MAERGSFFRGACLSSTGIVTHSVCLSVCLSSVTLFKILQFVQYLIDIFKLLQVVNMSLIVTSCHKLSQVITSLQKSCHKLSQVVKILQKSSKVVTSCNHWLSQLVTTSIVVSGICMVSKCKH